MSTLKKDAIIIAVFSLITNQSSADSIPNSAVEISNAINQLSISSLPPNITNSIINSATPNSIINPIAVTSIINSVTATSIINPVATNSIILPTVYIQPNNTSFVYQNTSNYPY